jgi:DNA polymerase III alpha subunit
MFQLRCRTEYSFRQVFGSIDKVLAVTNGPAAITDTANTFGHVEWNDACRKLKRKPIFGVELAVVNDMKSKTKQGINMMAFLAKSNAGLKELYEIISISTRPEHHYYVPRLDYAFLFDVSDEIIILSGAHPVWGSLPKRDNLYVELGPMSPIKAAEFARTRGMKTVAVSDPRYPRVQDKDVYEAVAGRDKMMSVSPMHMLSDDEWRIIWPGNEDALKNTTAIAEMCNAELPRASMVKSDPKLPSLRTLCEEFAPARNVNLKDKVYADRLTRELDMIAEKKFEDYFYLVWDLVRYAKTEMLVGPARGSSCGSLVCYLLSITEIDPIPYGLLFERFIDINRADLPDIDIDFPDDRRDMVFEYLKQKYGAPQVARLGTVMRYKAKSAIDTIAKALSVPIWEVTNLKNSIIERSTGDSRAGFCILDTFNELEVGQNVIKKFPQMILAGDIEGHASGFGQHAAGIVVTSDPLHNFCSINEQTGAVMIDKHDAEKLNLLKIDALGLRTLSVLQDCLDQVGWSREQLMAYPTDDVLAFKVLNDKKFAGIFQFEGHALQSLISQMFIENFEDIAAVTALARPGPLHSGGTTEYIRRRTGENPTVPLHPMIAHTTEVTYGVVVYQEQVMQIAREMGKLSWEDVSSLRKAMSKSLGKEFFDQYWVRFRVGAIEQGIEEDDALRVWNQINTMGSWSFNRSHAVAYAMVSYWCMLLKAKFPLEFGAACLRNARDETQSIRLLRELVKEGYEFRAYDAMLSQKHWSVQDGVLIGGLTNIKGVGDKMADDIIKRRSHGAELTASQTNKLANGLTPFDHLFECEELWGHLKANPEKYAIKSRMKNVEHIQCEDYEVDCCFIAKITEKDLRDLNDPTHVKKRNGSIIRGQALMVLFTAEDDTDQIPCMVDRHDYLKLGLPLIEEGRMNDWFIFKGRVKSGFRQVRITNWRKLSGIGANPMYAKKPDDPAEIAQG